MSDEGEQQLGWWVISGENFLSALRRVEAGESADLIYAEHYANSDIEDQSG